MICVFVVEIFYFNHIMFARFLSTLIVFIKKISGFGFFVLIVNTLSWSSRRYIKSEPHSFYHILGKYHYILLPILEN